MNGLAVEVSRLARKVAPAKAPTAPGRPILNTTVQSTLPKRQCEAPETSVVPISARWTVAEAATGLVPIASSSVVVVTPYAMLTLAAAADGGTPVSVVRLADDQELPRKFLEAILADLRRAELVVSRMGTGGGYLLARPATQISIGAVIRAVDGPLAEVRGERPQAMTYDGAATHLRTVWVAVRSSVRSVLDGTSLADVLRGDFPAAVEEALKAPDAWENR